MKRIPTVACVYLAFITFTSAASPHEPFRSIQVAADGSAKFTSIQNALDSIPADNCERIVVRVAAGGYNERIRIDHNRITLQGAGADTTRIWFNFPRSEYDRRYDRIGPGIVNVFGDDTVIEGLTIENTQPSHEHAFALYGQPNRFILAECAVLSEGGDTVSLWNTSFGMYYHHNCHFRGGVDFVCPRGWCFVRDSTFESVGQSAAIWQDGHMNLDMKFVLQNCEFDGPDDFWLGRNHYPSQFFLIDCRFSSRMADKPIGVVSKPTLGLDPRMWERKYFHHSHRDGGDYAWHDDNLDTYASAAGSRTKITDDNGEPDEHAGTLTAEEITPSWTFDQKWDPESTIGPQITEVDFEDDTIRLYFSEPVAGGAASQIVREDGSIARLVAGSGSRQWNFRGGNGGSTPTRLKLESDRPYGTVATLQARNLDAEALPKANPRRRIKISLAGDSTVATYSVTHAYQGWGWALGGCFDDRVTVFNHAKGGRSSKSFRSEGWWNDVLDDHADYVIIQFGHNDNPGKGPERETDPARGSDFRANLQRYVEEVREQGGVPILVTPPTRRKFDDSGLIIADEPNNPYADAVRELGAALDCSVIDLNRLTKTLFTRLGPAHSDWLQPDGDRTHFHSHGLTPHRRNRRRAPRGRPTRFEIVCAARHAHPKIRRRRGASCPSARRLLDRGRG